MFKKILICLFFVLCGATMYAEQPTVVIAPFDLIRVETNDGEALYQVFLSSIARRKKFRVIDRSALPKIKKLIDFQDSDWSNNEKVAQLGAALNANVVVTCKIMFVRSIYITTINMIDVNTTEIKASENNRSDSFDDLIANLSTMAINFAAKYDNI